MTASASAPRPTPRLGAHVGRLADLDPVQEARSRGADLVQVFLGDPQDWKADPLAGIDPPAVRAATEAAGVGIVVHAPYVINVATTNNRIRIPSRKLLQGAVDAAAAVGAELLVVHGGHLPKGEDPQLGFDNWRKAVDQLDHKLQVLIENTAGGDNAMARELDQLDRLWDAVGHSGVGLCLDTCHAFSAGLDLATVAADVRAITGRIDLVHANDSRDPAGSGRDRHTDLGDGEIGAEAIAAVVAAAGAPAILETPGAKNGHAADITWLRERLATPARA